MNGLLHYQRSSSAQGKGLSIKGKDYSVMRGKWRLVVEELYDLSTDPGQENDIAAQHPEMAKRLRSDHEKWWNRIAERSAGSVFRSA